MDNKEKLFRKKPVVIEAIRLQQRFGWPDWLHDAVSANRIITHGLGKYGEGEVYIEIETLEGVMRGNEGDWIIRGVKGEIYPCKPDIFEATYELASQPTANEELIAALADCAQRFYSCILANGSGEEYAELAVKKYRDLIGKIKGE